MTAYKQNADKRLVTQSLAQNVKNWNNRECSQVCMVDTISQPGCAECGAGGLVLTDYRPYAFLRALLTELTNYATKYLNEISDTWGQRSMGK